MARPKLKVVPHELAFVLDEVLEYDVPGLEFETPPTVIDLGANIGAFAAWAMDRWPGALVTCFEPHPDNARVLRENMAGLLVNVDERAVMADAGPRVSLQDGQNRACSKTIRYGIDVTGPAHIVPCLDPSLLGPCDVLKVDVEGAELGILRDYKHLARCKAVLLEWHNDGEVEAIWQVLTDAGLRQHSYFGRVQRWVRADVLEKLPAPQPTFHLVFTTLGWKHSPFYTQSRTELALLCAARGITLTFQDNQTSGVDRARNISIENARANASTFTHFMFCDSDIAFRSQDIVDMMTSGLDVVGGSYPKKAVNWDRVEKAVKNGVPAEKLALYANDFVANAKDGPLVGVTDPATGKRYAEMAELGTGFLMLSRRCIEQYIEHWKDEIAYITDYEPRGVVHHMVFSCERDPACELEATKRALLNAAAAGLDSAYPINAGAYRRALEAGKPSNGRYLTEDFSFCRRWAMMGGKVYCAIDANLVHQGPMLQEGRVGLQFDEAKP